MSKSFFKDVLGCMKCQKNKDAKRNHPYDEVSDEQLQSANEGPKRRPRAYDEIEIDDEEGPTMVDGSLVESSEKKTDSSNNTNSKTLNYIEVDVKPQDVNSEVRRSEPPTQYSTVEVGGEAGTNKRKVSIDLQE